MAITTAFPTSFKGELPQALHNFVASTGHIFKAALIKHAPVGTYGAGTANYSDITGNSDEASGSGYTAGGFAWTAAQNTTPLTSGTTAYWSWSVNPSWTGATLDVDGCVFYNSSSSNKAVYVGDFGGRQQVTGGTLTIVLPANGASTSILRIT